MAARPGYVMGYDLEYGDDAGEGEGYAMECPNCEGVMVIIVATKDPLHRCPNCGLEAYESAIVEHWERIDEGEGLGQ